MAAFSEPRFGDQLTWKPDPTALEHYLSSLETALAELADRTDVRAQWARSQLLPERATVRAMLEAIPSVAAERLAHSEAVAQEQATLATEESSLADVRRAREATHRARQAFAAACQRAEQATRFTSDLRRGLDLAGRECSHSTEWIAEVAHLIRGYDYTPGCPNSNNTAHIRAVGVGRSANRAALSWEIADETRYLGHKPRTLAGKELAGERADFERVFQIRWDAARSRFRDLPEQSEAVLCAAEGV
jgi:hypothetical protein